MFKNITVILALSDLVKAEINPPCPVDASECEKENNFYWQNPETCECECAIVCAAIYSVDLENCRCVPLSDSMACDPVYEDQFCDENGEIIQSGSIAKSIFTLSQAIFVIHYLL